MRGARAKWAIPEPDQRLPAIEPDPAEDIFELLDLDELEALPAPTWLIADLIADHGLSVLYGDPGAGKSFIAIDMALRLAFAMATAIQPEVLLMDEWFLAGDADFLARAEERLTRLVGQADILVIATHDMGVVRRWCTRAIRIDAGAIVADGPVAEVLGPA
jgi:lipopolysaccharide transport system ATP-binding protein